MLRIELFTRGAYCRGQACQWPDVAHVRGPALLDNNSEGAMLRQEMSRLGVDLVRGAKDGCVRTEGVSVNHISEFLGKLK